MTASDEHTSPSPPEVELFCHRCGRILRPGKGNWYEVRIEAVCDPASPHFDDSYSGESLADAVEYAIEGMEDYSDLELAEQVYRRMVVTLCRRCYRKWIENPVGDGTADDTG